MKLLQQKFSFCCEHASKHMPPLPSPITTPYIFCLMDDTSYYLSDNKLHRLATGSYRRTEKWAVPSMCLCLFVCLSVFAHVYVSYICGRVCVCVFACLYLCVCLSVGHLFCLPSRISGPAVCDLMCDWQPVCLSVFMLLRVCVFVCVHSPEHTRGGVDGLSAITR